MKIAAYLNFAGSCAEAFRFYEQVLGGALEMQTHGESPMREHTPPEWHDTVLHARLVVGDEVLMGSDAPPQHFERPQGFSVSLQVEEPEEAERIFAALAQGGEVRMPLGETFWARRFGMLVDRFGTPWMVNCGRGG